MVYTLLMFRGKKWKRYAKKETVEERNHRRRSAAIKGHRTRRRRRLVYIHKLAENADEAISMELHKVFPVVNSSDVPENK